MIETACIELTALLLSDTAQKTKNQSIGKRNKTVL